MKITEITAWYENLPKYLKVLIQVIAGSIIGGVYRILKYIENKNALTLVVGILNFVGLGFVFWIVDIVTEILYNRITILAD